MDPQQIYTSIKKHAWADWTEWHQVYELIFASQDPDSLFASNDLNLQKINNKNNMQQALLIITKWLRKNVGASEHSRALKMQKLLLVETLA